MTGRIAQRLIKLERKLLPSTRFVCVLDTPENHALVDQGYIPHSSFPAPEHPESKELRRLGSRDMVIFMMALEMGL
jgi:hypothetical protein